MLDIWRIDPAKLPVAEHYKEIMLLDTEDKTYVRKNPITIYLPYEERKDSFRLKTYGFALARAMFMHNMKDDKPFYVSLRIREYQTKRQYHKIRKYLHSNLLLQDAYFYLPEGFRRFYITGYKDLGQFRIAALIVPEDACPEGIGEIQVRQIRRNRHLIPSARFWGRTWREKSRGILWLLEHGHIRERIIRSTQGVYYFYSMTEKGYALSREKLRAVDIHPAQYMPENINGLGRWQAAGGFEAFADSMASHPAISSR